MYSYFQKRWYERAGYKEVLVLALPMILSTGSWSLQNFIDRMFLSWYSAEAIAASMPASLLTFTIICIFIGIVTIINTFVAQYYGARQYEHIGAIVWQGIYLSLISVFVVLPFYFVADEIFTFFDHGKEITRLEAIYFGITLLGSPFIVLMNAVSSFYSGTGNTKVVMWVNIFVTIINIVLDYLLIFGFWNIPALGIKGAAIATVIATGFGAALFLLLFLTKTNNQIYSAIKSWRFDLKLFKSLIKFGFPNGLQMQLEVAAFTAFLMYVGRVGLVELSATNIAFNINTLAFMPMIGMMIAVSTLVGQYLGDNKPDLAEKATYSGFQIAAGFFGLVGLIFLSVPMLFIEPFGLKSDPEEFLLIAQMAKVMLIFVAFYCLLDAGVFIFAGGLKGAGDTAFVALATTVLSWLLMVLPTAWIVTNIEHPIYWLWVSVTLYTAVLSVVLILRFRGGKWKSMRVIEVKI